MLAHGECLLAHDAMRAVDHLGARGAVQACGPQNILRIVGQSVHERTSER